MSPREVAIEEAAMLFATTPTPANQDNLASLAIPLAVKMTKAVARKRGLPTSRFDYEQVALDSLLSAMERFKPVNGKDTRFSGMLWTVINRRCIDGYRRLCRTRARRVVPRQISIQAVQESANNRTRSTHDVYGFGFLPNQLIDKQQVREPDCLEPVWRLPLTNREAEILRTMLATHCDVTRTAELLGISPNAVWQHMGSIKAKARKGKS